MDTLRKLKEHRNMIEQSKEFDNDLLNGQDAFQITRFVVYRKDTGESSHNRFKQFLNDVHSEWNGLIRKQPKIPAWICIGIFISSSVIIWCKFLFFHVMR